MFFLGDRANAARDADKSLHDSSASARENVHHGRAASVNAGIASILNTALSELKGSLLGGRYQLLEVSWPTQLDTTYKGAKYVGEGGYGATFLAEDKTDSRQVIVKLFFDLNKNLICSSPNHTKTVLYLLGLAKKECSMAKALMSYGGDLSSGRSRFVKCLHDGVNDTRVPHIALEYLGETNLKQWLDQEGKPSRDDAYRITIMMLQGLKHIEDKFVHRDIKPANIMIWRDPRDSELYLKYIDYGLMVPVGRACPRGGPPSTKPPESRKTDYVAESSFDVYSVGATIFYLFCGEYPYMRLWHTVDGMIFRKETPIPGYEPSNEPHARDYVEELLRRPSTSLEALCWPDDAVRPLYKWIVKHMMAANKSSRSRASWLLQEDILTNPFPGRPPSESTEEQVKAVTHTACPTSSFSSAGGTGSKSAARPVWSPLWLSCAALLWLVLL